MCGMPGHHRDRQCRSKRPLERDGPDKVGPIPLLLGIENMCRATFSKDKATLAKSGGEKWHNDHGKKTEGKDAADPFVLVAITQHYMGISSIYIWRHVSKKKRIVVSRSDLLYRCFIMCN